MACGLLRRRRRWRPEVVDKDGFIRRRVCESPCAHFEAALTLTPPLSLSQGSVLGAGGAEYAPAGSQPGNVRRGPPPLQGNPAATPLLASAERGFFLA